MKKRYYTLLFLLCLHFTSHAQLLTTEGSTFWVGFMENHEQTFIDLELHITATENVTVQISIPGTSFNRSFPVIANNTNRILVPTNLAMARDSERAEQKGVLVQILEGKKASVFALNNRYRSADATVVLPIESLGKSYLVMAHAEPDLQSRYSQFLVLAAEDSTEIEITPSVRTRFGKPAGVPFTITLNRGEVYQVQSFEDLTGTKIQSVGADANSCKNFAVFGGNEWTRVGQCGSAPDHLYEQMFPINTWGKEFTIIPYEARTGGDLVKILGSEDSTTVILDNIPFVVINEGEHLSFLVDNVASIRADKPISVAQLTRSQNCDNSLGDPFMIMVSPNEQRLNRIAFNALSVSSITDYYLNVLVRTIDQNSAKLDGESILSWFRPVPNDTAFSYARIPITRGNHTLEADSGFIAYVYGFGFIESFGYLTGVSLRPLDLAALAQRADGTLSQDTLRLCLSETFTLRAEAEELFQLFDWTLSDGTVLQGKEVRHQFDEVGVFSATLTASNLAGECATEASSQVWIEVTEPDSLSVKGQTQFCKSSIDTAYYTLATHTADSIVWQVEGGSLVSGQHTDSIAVLWQIENLRTPSTGTIRVIPFNKNGCEGDTATFAVTLNPLQQLNPPNGATQLCANVLTEPVAYRTEPLENAQYQWKIQGGQIVAGNGTPEITVRWQTPTDTVGRGSLWLEGVEIANQFCYENSDTLRVELVPPPNPTLSLQLSDTELCPDEPLIAMASADTAFTTFRWEWGNGEQAQGTTLNTLFEESGNYQIRLTAETDSGVCFVQTDTVFQVEVFNLEATLDGSGSVCPNVSGVSYIAQPDTLFRYEWSVVGGILQSGQGTDSITVAWGSTNANAYVQVTPIAPTGCRGDSVRFPVRVNRVLTPEVSQGETLLCLDAADSIPYALRPTEGSSYQWFVEGGTVVEGQGTASAKISWTQFGVGKLWLEESNVADTLCNGFSDTLFVEILPEPSDTLVATSNVTEACVGEFFEWEIARADTAYRFFDWDFGDGTTPQIGLPRATFIQHAYDAPGEYIVTLKAYTGSTCQKVAIFIDTVHVPIPTAAVSGDAFICEMDAPEVYQIVNPEEGYQYHWQVLGGTIVREETTEIEVQWGMANREASIRVVPQNTIGCLGDTVAYPVRISPLQPTTTPQGATNLCLNAADSVIYHVPETQGYAYRWQVSGGDILTGNGAHQIAVRWQGAGQGSVQLLASNIIDTLCFAASDVLNVRIKPSLAADVSLVSVSHSLTQENQLEVRWRAADVVADTLLFSLERRRVFPDTLVFEPIELPFGWQPAQTEYFLVDDVPNSSAESYQYRLQVTSECGETIAVPSQQSILITALSSDAPEEELALAWSEYIGWQNGVATYELWRQTENDSELVRLENVGALSAIRTDTRAGFEHCFRIAAVENGGNRAVAWSNERCITLAHRLTIGNVFTPNADGYNDTFFIVKLEMYPENTFRVFNRWGEEVYRKEGYQNRWDGTANGRELPEGTYFFELQIRSERAEIPVIKGPVTILR